MNEEKRKQKMKPKYLQTTHFFVDIVYFSIPAQPFQNVAYLLLLAQILKKSYIYYHLQYFKSSESGPLAHAC
jgi:hypothetical protein